MTKIPDELREEAQKAGFSEKVLAEILRLASHPVLGRYVSLRVSLGDIEQAADQVVGVVRRRLGPAVLPGAVRGFLLGVSEGLGANPAEDFDFTRPREEHLLEGLGGLAVAKEFYAQPGRVNKMAVVPGDPAEMKTLVVQIGIVRQVVRTSVRFVEALLGYLARLETRGEKLVRGYEMVRAAALRDPELGDLLQDPELYLYRPAQEAAELRKDNEVRARLVQEETEKKVRLEADRKNLLGGDLGQLMDSLRRLLATPDDRGASR